MLSVAFSTHDGRVSNIPLQINKALLQIIDATKVIPVLFKTEIKNGNNLCCVNELKQHFVDLQRNISCSSKSRLVLPFWYWLTEVDPDKGSLNRQKLHNI